jgi:hypothetical protein
MRQFAILLYVLGMASAVFGLLGAVELIDFNFFAAVFLFFIFKEASEIVMALSLSMDE